MDKRPHSKIVERACNAAREHPLYRDHDLSLFEYAYIEGYNDALKDVEDKDKNDKS